MNGIFEETENVLEDGRVIERTTTYTDGRKLKRAHRTAAMVYRDIYKPDVEYTRGDVATYSGCAWICRVDLTKAKPGTSDDWRMMVKAGRDGKDGKDGKPGERGPEGKPGMVKY